MHCLRTKPAAFTRSCGVAHHFGSRALKSVLLRTVVGSERVHRPLLWLSSKEQSLPGIDRAARTPGFSSLPSARLPDVVVGTSRHCVSGGRQILESWTLSGRAALGLGSGRDVEVQRSPEAPGTHTGRRRGGFHLSGRAAYMLRHHRVWQIS